MYHQTQQPIISQTWDPTEEHLGEVGSLLKYCYYYYLLLCVPQSSQVLYSLLFIVLVVKGGRISAKKGEY